MKNLDLLIQMALEEDIGSGDITTNAIVDENQNAEAFIKAKQPLTVAGIEIAKLVFEKFDSGIKYEILIKDGEEIESGTKLAHIKGKTRTLLTCERTALNFVQHLSGIATFTKIFVDSVKNTKIKILDTRKTTPAYRMLEKYAVKMGDGENHRIGLFDRYLIKNNHIEIAGGIKKAIEKVKTQKHDKLLIEVETRTLDEVSSAIKSGVDIIMLDNMSLDNLNPAIQIVNKKAKIEISGNISLNNIKSYANLDIDYISIGAITHSAPSADINMLII